MTAIRESEPAASGTAPEAGYGAMPDTDGANFYLADHNLALALQCCLTADEFAHAERILTDAGAVAGGELNRLAALADRNPPQRVQYDRRGKRVDCVEYHPAYREMERIAFERFQLSAVSHRDGALGWPGSMPAVMKYALSYVLIQAEFGLFCPVNVPAGFRHPAPLARGGGLKLRAGAALATPAGRTKHCEGALRRGQRIPNRSPAVPILQDRCHWELHGVRRDRPHGAATVPAGLPIPR